MPTLQHSTLRPSVAVKEETTVSIHQLVVRERDEEPPEEWIVTNIKSTPEGRMIILADPNFEFRLPVAEDVFQKKGFRAVTTENGAPVWAY